MLFYQVKLLLFALNALTIAKNLKIILEQQQDQNNFAQEQFSDLRLAEAQEQQKFIHSAQTQISELEAPTTQHQRRRLSVSYHDCITTRSTSINLMFKGNARSFQYNQASNWGASQQGCWGGIFQINQASSSLSFDNTKSFRSSQTDNPVWGVDLRERIIGIKSVLIINVDNDDCQPSNFNCIYKTKVLVCENEPQIPDFDENQCQTFIPQKTMLDGGWYIGKQSLNGKYIVLYNPGGIVNFSELFAFTQEPIQIGHHVTASSHQSKVLNTKVILYRSRPEWTGKNQIGQQLFGNTDTVFNSDRPSNPPFIDILLPAYVAVKRVFVFGGYDTQTYTLFGLTNPWISQSTLEFIAGYNKDNQQIKCNSVYPQAGSTSLTIFNYYQYNYLEVDCDFGPVNKIRLQKQYTVSYERIWAGGVGLQANCDCLTTSFDQSMFSEPKQIQNYNFTELGTLSEPIKIVELNQNTIVDTISTTCSPYDGFTKCKNHRKTKISFNGVQVKEWPHQNGGLDWDGDQQLTIHPSLLSVSGQQTIMVTTTYQQQIVYTQNITVTTCDCTHTKFLQPFSFADNTKLTFPSPQSEAKQIHFQKTAVKDSVSSVCHKKDGFSFCGPQYITFVDKITGAQINSWPLGFEWHDLSWKLKVNPSLAPSVYVFTAVLSLPNHIKLTQDITVKVKQQNEIALIPNNQSTTQIQVNELPLELDDPVQPIEIIYEKSKQVQFQETKIPPVLTFSRFNSIGQFTLQFSEPMNLLPLKTRSLKRGHTIQQQQEKKSAKQTVEDQSNFLLTQQHLNLTIISPNTTLHRFTWKPLNITSQTIQIQIDFENPLYISTDQSILDQLQVTVLQPAFKYFKSLSTGLTAIISEKQPTLTIPPQVLNVQHMEAIAQSTNTSVAIGQTTIITNTVVQLLLSGSMSQMWSMVNSQQVITSQQMLNVRVPGNFLEVMVQVDKLASFNILPVDRINSAIFNLTTTDSPGTGLHQFRVVDYSFVNHLEMQFYMIIIVVLVYVVYALSNLFNNRAMAKIKTKLRLTCKWGLILILLVESCLDFSIGAQLRLEKPKFITVSDYFDTIFAIVAVTVAVSFPIFIFFFLNRNIEKLNEAKFQEIWGQLYERYKTRTVQQRKTAIFMVCWFQIRRFLIALCILRLRNYSFWFQFALFFILCMIDLCLYLHFKPLKNPIGQYMEQFNGFILTVSAYFPIMYTDITPDPVTKYYIGWYALGLVALLIAVNVLVVAVTGIKLFINRQVKRWIWKRKVDKIIKNKVKQLQSQQNMESHQESQNKSQKSPKLESISEVRSLQSDVQQSDIKRTDIQDLQEQHPLEKNLVEVKTKNDALVFEQKIAALIKQRLNPQITETNNQNEIQTDNNFVNKLDRRIGQQPDVSNFYQQFTHIQNRTKLDLKNKKQELMLKQMNQQIQQITRQ